MEHNKDMDMMIKKLIYTYMDYEPEDFIAALYEYKQTILNKKGRYADEAEKIKSKNKSRNNTDADLQNAINNALGEKGYDPEEFKQFVKHLYKEIYRMRGWETSVSGGGSGDQLVQLCKELLTFKDGDILLDVGSGAGEAIADFYDNIKDYWNITYKGVEINPERARVSRMFLEMIGTDADITEGDVLKLDHLPQYTKAYVYPPFGWIYPDNDLLSEKYGASFNFRRNSEWLFVYKTLQDISDNGRITAVLPTSTLYRATGREIRKYLIDNKYIEGIICLPSRTLASTSIPVVIVVLRKGSEAIKLLDASSDAADLVEQLHGQLTRELHVKDIIRKYMNEAANIPYEKVSDKDYNLNPSLYLDDDEQEAPNAVSLGSVCNVINGSQYTLSRFKGSISKMSTEYQLLTPGDIIDGSVDYDSLTYIEPDDKLLKFALQVNDIVVTTKSTKIKTFIARDLPNRSIIVTGGMLIIRPYTDKINSVFLKTYLDSSAGMRAIGRITQGAAIKTISNRELLNMKVPCPPIDEQNSYAKRYINLLSVERSLKIQLESIKGKLNAFYDDNCDNDQ